MYERFTDRARKAMQLANQEAQRFNHEYIGTEHILLGLIKEGTGVAANVLHNLDVDLRKIRIEVETIVQTGPDKVTMSKLPQTPRARKVIEYAMDESRNLNHNYVGTEHLLLGLLREQEGVAAQVLLNVGLKLDEVRAEVANMLGCCVDSGESGAVEHESNTGAAPQTGLNRYTTQALHDARHSSTDVSRQKQLARHLLAHKKNGYSMGYALGSMASGHVWLLLMAAASLVLALATEQRMYQFVSIWGCGVFVGAILRDVGGVLRSKANWPFTQMVTNWMNVEAIASGDRFEKN